MAVAVNASSPARVTNTSGTTATTAAFNPPAALLVAVVHGDSSAGSGVTATITNNGTALTWTEIATRNDDDVAGTAPGMVSARWAALPAGRTGMTVTATLTGGGAGHPSLKVYVLTGHDTTTPIGAVTEGTSTVNNLTTTAFTTQAAAGLGFAAGTEWNSLGAPTSTDMVADAVDTANISAVSGYKTLGNAGSSATFNLDAGGAAAAQWNWISWEIRPGAAAAQSISPAGMASGEAVGTLTVAPGPVAIAPAAIASGEALGAVVVTAGGALVTVTGIPSAQALGQPSVAITAGPTTVTVVGIPDPIGGYFEGYTEGYTEFGSPTVSLSITQVTVTGGVPSDETWGVPTVSAGSGSAQIVFASSANSAEAFGVIRISGDGDWIFEPTIIAYYWESARPLRYRIPVAATVLLVGSEWVEKADPSEELVHSASRVYRGGRRHVVSASEAAELVAAGYSEFVSQEIR